ncbi:MAG: hemolysin III family protein [Bacteroidales bacterium]|nr:hemolysin III family protein [Bacteroidales bacterium]
MTKYTEVSRFSHKEEMANALSHFIGALLSTAALVLMVVQSVKYGNGWHIVSTSIFGTSMIILYLSSTMTHYLQKGKLKNFFFSLDKIAIYLLIAGTYTPFALVTLNGPLGWTIFGIEWAFAIIGSAIILKKPVNFEKGVNTWSVISYAAMGWLIIIAIVPLIKRLPSTGWLLILLGGVLYTIGIFFYKKCSFRFHHLVWHLFVIAGTFTHFLTIYFYVIPR